MYAYLFKHKILYLFMTIFCQKVSAENQLGKIGENAVAACSNFNYLGHRRLYFQDGDRSDICQREMSLWLDEINEKALEFNVLTADFAWGMSVNPENPNLAGKGAILDITRSTWRKDACKRVARIDASLVNDFQRRELGFLCRGATLNAQESETLSVVLEEMQTMYTSAKICIPKSNTSQPENGGKQDHDKNIISYLTDVNGILTKIERLCEHDSQKCNTINILKANTNLNAKKNEEANIYLNLNQYNSLESKENSQNDWAPISNAAILLAAKMAAENGVLEGRRDFVCFSGEPDLERLMARSRSEDILKWAWLAWREKVGPPIRPLYEKMVEVKNSAARRTGYLDIGEIWREELEIPDLENLVEDLLQQTSDLYRSLHGVVRYFLRQFFGPEVVTEHGPIPAHLLGNMWAQNWENVLDLILPEAKQIDLDTIIRNTNWTTKDMLKRAEDFYTSIGLFPMTEKFWKYSYFGDGDGGRNNRSGNDERINTPKCHGTAANMFIPGDFRMIYCAGLSVEDFYVLHHEMGHIEYYMCYDPTLPVIFQDGANSAFQESIGDAIMYAVLTPQHLQRLGLIKDSLVYEYSTNKYQTSRNIKKRDINNRKPFTDLNKKLTYDRYKKSMEFIKKLENNEKSNDKTFNSGNSQKKNYFKTFSNRDLNKERVSFDDDFQDVNLKRKDIYRNMDQNDIENDAFAESEEFEEVPDENIGVDFDTILLLRQALTKLPQIPFGYIVDKYRWDIFSGKIQPEDYNKAFWAYVTKHQGIQPPDGADRPEYYFDAAAKFHVPDNTPYIRYFLSSFLQVQMFRGMCQWSLFGQAAPASLSSNLRVPMPLHRCDIYGSKKAGRKLREMMSKGSSVNWSEALYILTGDRTISSSALHEYFAPLKTILNNLIAKHDIPLGW